MASLNRPKITAQHLSPDIPTIDIPLVSDTTQNMYNQMIRKIIHKHSEEGSKCCVFLLIKDENLQPLLLQRKCITHEFITVLLYYLWFLIVLAGILFITLCVDPESSSHLARSTHSEDEPGSIRKNNPQPLWEKKEQHVGKVVLPLKTTLLPQNKKWQEESFGCNTSFSVTWNNSFITLFPCSKG